MNPNRITTKTDYVTGNTNVVLTVRFDEYDIVPIMYSFDDTVIPDYTMVIDDTNMVATTNYNDAVKRIVIPNYDSGKTLAA